MYDKINDLYTEKFINSKIKLIHPNPKKNTGNTNCNITFIKLVNDKHSFYL